MITKKEYDYLKMFEKQINQAYYHNYVTGVPSRKDLEEMNSIAAKYNLKDPNMNYGCSKCQLNLLKRIGKIYYEYKNKNSKPKTNETKNKS